MCSRTFKQTIESSARGHHLRPGEGVEIEPPDLHVLERTEASLQQLQVLILDVAEYQQTPVEQEPRQVARSGSDLQDVLAEKLCKGVVHLHVVGAELRHAGERLSADMTDVAHRPILEQRPCGRHRVTEANLLSLRVVAAAVGDRHLEDAAPQFGDLDGDLRLEAKPIRSQRDALEELGSEDLVAGLHVGEVQVRQDVRHQRQDPVRHRVPEQVYPSMTGDEPRSVNDVRIAGEQRRQENRDSPRGCIPDRRPE